MHRTSASMVTGICAAVVSACGGGGDEPLASGGDSTPDTFATEPVFGALTFTQPVLALQAPGNDDRWYVVERAGVVRVFDNDTSVSQSSVAVDLSGLVESGPGEAGLLGMAFHPDFASNGSVYLSYTVSGAPLVSRIDRFISRDGGTTLDSDSRLPVISVAQNQANHNGGHLAFGPDGFLYGAFGDGGGAGDPAGNAQTTSNILGAIIRIDVDQGLPYEIPTNNPFAGNALCADGRGSGACPEIFAYGLRNPWRFSFDRETGELYVGDVGQDSFEEINRIVNGNNYGWNIREGANCFNATSCTSAGLSDPIHEYGRAAGRSVTGGVVYRGAQLPALAGRYVFGDFVSGRIFSIDAAAQSLVGSADVTATEIGIVSFAETGDGEIYVVDFSGGLHRMVAN